MNINLLRLSIFFTTFFLSGCAANNYVSTAKEADSPRLNLQYNIQEIEIVDSRQKEEDIKLPVVSKPNMLIKHIPVLTASHRELLEKVIRENTTSSGTSIKAVIDITDSYKEFTSTWSSEKEKCYAQLQVSFIKKDTGELITGCHTNGELFVQSVDATNQRMEELYKLTLKNVLYNCLKSLPVQEVN
ncbi:hypothetical protein MKJ04_11245 [Pontibacter sp. E15-1]|uniref:hypothetical protein n=1 Tax=Pontibacter sp. E15-1 TaxID=2919918 RepID=UPI001F501F9C|nr:hypothetical protein [Pontibacter sp. E15-1]MCJ8165419.1 hypothetical protein [Pontibacter sp. E15-1]